MYGNNYFSGWQTPTYNVPQVPQQIPQPTQDIFVPSAAAAEAYIVAPNCAVRLWDSNMKTFYIRRTDQSGRSFPMETYDFNRREPQTAPAAVQNTDYSAEIKALTQRIERLEGMNKEAEHE